MDNTQGTSEDEFDALPDIFEGIDWESVPDLAQSHDDQPTTSQTFENAPNWGLTAEASHSYVDSMSERAAQQPPRPASAQSSSQYSFDDLDETALAQLDALESTYTRRPLHEVGHNTPNPSTSQLSSTIASHAIAELQSWAATSSSSSSHITPPSSSNISNVSRDTDTPLVASKTPTSSTLKRPSSQEEGNISVTPRKRAHVSATPSPKKGKGKGKQRQDSNEGVRKVLQGFEDELTCPICFEIIAAAHLGNPCGHSYCGECAWGWISKNRRYPTCALCRTKLSADTPIIPNFSVDHTIEKHIAALAANGTKEWSNGGAKYDEWTQRKLKWKADAAKRAVPPRSIDGDSTTEDEDSDSDSEDSEDSASEISDGWRPDVPALQGAPLHIAPPPHLPVPHPAAPAPYRGRGGYDRGRGERGGRGRGRGGNGNWRGRRGGGNAGGNGDRGGSNFRGRRHRRRQPAS